MAAAGCANVPGVTCNALEVIVARIHSNARIRVREHRARLRKQGLRPIQIWVPDVRARGFATEAHRQSRAVAASRAAAGDQAFVEAISEWPAE